MEEKLSKTSNKSYQLSLKLNFISKSSSNANCDDNEAYANSDICEDMAEKKETVNELTEKSEEVLSPTLNWAFLDGILLAIENVKTDVTVCAEQVNRTEIRISTAEDSLTSLQAKVHKTKTSKKRRWRLDEDSWT